MPAFTTSGILLVDKPPEWTSFDVVNFVRSRFNVPKIGHCGTLDPAATGLLVLVLGKLTALSAKLSGDDKVYDATLLLGKETDSGDMTGKVTAEADYRSVSEEMLRAKIAEFTGVMMQVPPMVSAVKKDGHKLYELARKGMEVEREPREITIHSVDVLQVDLPECRFVMHCSKGTYVRTYCSDLGRALGVYGVLKSLRRLKSGRFSLENAVTVEQLKTMEQADLDILLRRFLFENLSNFPENKS